jgi:hypothetical protein
VNESPESATSTDEPDGAVEPANPTIAAPAEDADTLEPEPAPADAGEGGAEEPVTPPSRPPSKTKPPRTQQVLTAAVLALIALSFVLLAIEIANQ